MLSLPPTVRVFLAAGTTDMRKSYDTLAACAQRVLEQDPFSGHLFAFCGRRRDRVKILYWDGTGFWLFAKRLARGTFAWPDPGAGDRRCVSTTAIGAGERADSGRDRRWETKNPLAELD